MFPRILQVKYELIYYQIFMLKIDIYPKIQEMEKKSQINTRLKH